MNVSLRRVDTYSKEDIKFLFDLLKDRPPYANISHRKMPTFKKHAEFVKSFPYLQWDIIVYDGKPVGSFYITKNSELGIFVLQKYLKLGISAQVFKDFFKRAKGTFYANINPANKAAIALVQFYGFKHIQNTYIREADDV